MIFIGSDHRGYDAKEKIIQYLKSKKLEVVDCTPGPLNPEDDYPVATKAVISQLLAHEDINSKAILLCGSGQGVAMSANRFRGIRAVLGYDEKTVKLARNDDDANVLCMPSELTGKEHQDIVDEFLSTPFAGAPRFVRRIREMDEL